KRRLISTCEERRLLKRSLQETVNECCIEFLDPSIDLPNSSRIRPYQGAAGHFFDGMDSLSDGVVIELENSARRAVVMDYFFKRQHRSRVGLFPILNQSE